MIPREPGRRPESAVLVGIRCPYCHRLIARVSPGAVVQTVCPRCHAAFERKVPAAPPTL
jgi:phage FluMu protein Com